MGGAKTDGSSTWINIIGLLLLGVCYVGAIWNVVTTRREETQSNTIRLVHWQLELGVRDGVQALIEDFEAYKRGMGEPVKVVQIPIPEQVYSQYVTTQLIGGTAPDMIQIGKFPQEYLGRFFYPLSKHVEEPNPEMARRRDELIGREELTEKEQTELAALHALADQPWMDSFTDGLRSQFQTDFQEYYGVGFSTFTVRMYYNKDMFQRILGHDRPPRSYEEFIEFSREIEAFAEEAGESIQPIASSKYQADVFKNRYFSEITPDLVRAMDYTLLGAPEGVEKLAAMIQGVYTPWNPEYEAAVKVLLEIAEFFPKGFMSLGREDSGFSFVQGKAGMITSGSWDALSYLKKIEDQPEENRFEVGIFDLPSISTDHPVFGKYADGRASESDSGTGFAFGITRHTRNFDLCLEFLQFATTPDMNTKVNESAGWIPVIQGATPRELLKNFQPNVVGYFGNARLEVLPNGKVKLEDDQLFWVLIQGDISYEEYAERLWDRLPVAAATDYKRLYEGSMESVPNRQLRCSAFLANVVFGDEGVETRTAREIKFLRSLQPLVALLTMQPIADELMRRARAEVPDDPRILEFVEKFDRALQRELTQ